MKIKNTPVKHHRKSDLIGSASTAVQQPPQRSVGSTTVSIASATSFPQQSNVLSTSIHPLGNFQPLQQLDSAMIHRYVQPPFYHPTFLHSFSGNINPFSQPSFVSPFGLAAACDYYGQRAAADFNQQLQFMMHMMALFGSNGGGNGSFSQNALDLSVKSAGSDSTLSSQSTESASSLNSTDPQKNFSSSFHSNSSPSVQLPLLSPNSIEAQCVCLANATAVTPPALAVYSADRSNVKEKFACCHCRAGFETDSGRKSHENKHKCSTCPKTFPTAFRLARHEDTHSRKPAGPRFECHLCGKSYKALRSLRRHCEKHSTVSGTTPFDQASLEEQQSCIAEIVASVSQGFVSTPNEK